MAELLLVDEWAEPGAVGSHLRAVLPDEYTIIAGLTVHGQPLDAVVVGPQGLWVLLVKGWGGEVRPSRRGPWRELTETGQEVGHPNPALEADQATKALRAFLRDEFPELRPTIRHLVVLDNPEAKLMGTEATEPIAVTQDSVAETIRSMEAPSNGALLDGEVRQALALALVERRLTATQRASEPFVFRSGGLFGSGTKVWTIRAAVRHMDKHPEDGTFHLNNGTLAHWLSEQGAERLAELAREVLRQRVTDSRVPLETFLIGTGLVRRPRLSVRPKRLNLGCILSGEAWGCHLRAQKGRGRGYLFGTVRTSDPWLRVEPRSFSRGSLEAIVSADTQTLPISRKPWQAQILVESNGSDSEEPISIPVRVRVVGMPSRLNRRLLRPLAGAISAGLLGLTLGWSLGHWGLGVPGWFQAVMAPGISWAVACAALLGLFWAVLGGIRGWLQPLAWPISYATGRWLLRTLTWGVALSLLAVVSHWGWGEFGPDPGPNTPEATVSSVVLSALALAIVPAVLGEIRSAREEQRAQVRPAGRSLVRPLLMATVGLALVLVLVAGTLFLIVAWQQFDLGSKVSTAQQWTEVQWTQLGEGANDAIDQLTIRYYERQAPATIHPTRVPALTPGTKGGTP